MESYYTLLHVPSGASPAAIRSAYRKLVKTCHPDLHPGNANLTQQFVKISQAYDILSNPSSREEYDKSCIISPAAHSLWETPPRHPSAEKHAAEIYDLFMARNRKGHKGSLGFNFTGIVLTLLQSPITYCLLVVFFMLCMIKGLADGDFSTHHHTSHVITTLR